MKSHIKTLGMKKVWEWLTHPHAFAYVFLFGCMGLYGLVYVDLPYKDKTALNVGLDTYLENWRLHANSTKLFIVGKEGSDLDKECKELEQTILKLEMARLNIVGHPTLSPDQKAREISLIMSIKGDQGKKLEAAKSELIAVTGLYKELVANR